MAIPFDAFYELLVMEHFVVFVMVQRELDKSIPNNSIILSLVIKHINSILSAILVLPITIQLARLSSSYLFLPKKLLLFSFQHHCAQAEK